MPLEKDTLKNYKYTTFVETGTYGCEAIEFALDAGYKDIYSIELDKDLFANACKKYTLSNNVRLFNGDSSRILKEVLDNVKEDCLIWLDAHPIGNLTVSNCPVLFELSHICSWLNENNRNVTILIDDMRLFGDKDKKIIECWINELFPNYKIRRIKSPIGHDDIMEISK